MDENMALTPYETREILFYKTDNGDVKVEILLYQENLWLTQAKMAELFEVPLEDLLDDYNLFLLRGQGAQIKAIRQRLGLTQKAYAAQLGVPLQKFKRWEQGTVQIFKSTWEKYFKQT